MTKLDWEINIENLAARVSEAYGNNVATAIFERYGATCFDDLSPAYYGDVFSDLMQIDADS